MAEILASPPLAQHTYDDLLPVSEALQITRTLAADRATATTMKLAALACVPFSTDKIHMRSIEESSKLTLLEADTFEWLAACSRPLNSTPIQDVKEAIKRDMPPSRARHLPEVAVKDLVILGKEEKPVLALELDSLKLLRENASIQHTLSEITGRQVKSKFVPHLIIAEFLDPKIVPPESAISRVRKFMPRVVMLSPVDIRTYSL